MEPKQLRNERLAARLIKQLKQRHYDAYYCPNAEALRTKVRELIPAQSTITWGGSETIRKTGITGMLKAGPYRVFDRDEATTPEEKRRAYLQAFDCDYCLASVNAISEDGLIVNIDGNGNRVAAITWGPKRVIHIIGMNKVAHTLDAAIARARGTAAPINAQRLNINTPCKHDGRCHDCNAADSICSYIHLLRNSRDEQRHVVVLVGETLGF